MADVRSRGIVQVYTGNGKGKTSAAWGQVLRAVGHGWHAGVVRFLKSADSGEVTAAERLAPDVEVFGFTSDYDANINQSGSDLLRSESGVNYQTALKLVMSGKYDLIVLDEINNVLNYGFIDESDVIDLMNNRPPHVNLIFTGRYAPLSLIEAADLVTEMADVKHPFSSGEESRKGIEY